VRIGKGWMRKQEKKVQQKAQNRGISPPRGGAIVN